MCCAAWCRSGPAPVACPPPPFGQKPSKSALRLKDEKPWPTAALHPMRGHPAGHRPQPCQAKGRGRTRATRRPATVGTPIPRPPTPHCSSAAATTLSPARPPSLPPPAPKPNVPPKAGDRAVQTGPASPGGVHALPRPPTAPSELAKRFEYTCWLALSESGTPPGVLRAYPCFPPGPYDELYEELGRPSILPEPLLKARVWRVLPNVRSKWLSAEERG
jgi:hypothetical protein